MNLIIGNTSQLSYYFPDDYIRISSRNIDFVELEKTQWDSIYICFSEQRIYDNDIDYLTPNYYYTLDVISKLIPISDKIVVYTSCELWNNYNGAITLDLPPSFKPSHHEYTLSKFLLLEEINNLRQIDDRYKNIVIIHPFNFNSIHRKDYFLFGKIFDSIINKKQIEIGDTYFYRDICHTKYMVERSIQAKSDEIVGSGKLILINDFIRQLYSSCGLEYDKYVKENRSHEYRKINMIYAHNLIPYDNLLSDTLLDILK